jgi:precorrin-6B methylase 2
MSDIEASVTPERILEYSWGFAPTLIIDAAVRNRIFDALAGRPLTLDEMARATGASRRGLAAIVDALVGLKLASRDDGGRYGLTAESAAFLVSGRPGFLGGVFEHFSTQVLPNWLRLADTVRDGTPVHANATTADSSEYFSRFVEALFPLSYPSARALAVALDVAHATQAVSVLDLGAGSGVWGIAMAEASPQVRVRAVDLPDVLTVTRRIAGRFGVDERLTTVAGDLHEADFGTGHQVAILGHILHSEGPERSRALLGRVHAALAPGGTVAVAEFLVDNDRRGPERGLVFAVNMLVHTEAGGTYSFEEIADWLVEVGFTEPRRLAVPGPAPLVLATRR